MADSQSTQFKPCSYCLEVKPFDAFGPDSRMVSGRKSRCRVCAYLLDSMQRRLLSPADFWSRVEKRDDGCWVWTGRRNRLGYGITNDENGKLVSAHRLAWRLTHGTIPSDLQLCHHCDNPSCCNPSHLFLGTQADNMLDMMRKGRGSSSRKTHCPKGHVYDHKVFIKGRGYQRLCKQCIRDWHARDRRWRGIPERSRRG